MTIIPLSKSFMYVAPTGDWNLVISNGSFQIQPQVGNLEYSSGVNLDNLANLIISAKQHAVANGINWNNN